MDQLAGRGARVFGRIPSQRHQVRDARRPILLEDLGELGPAVGHADQVGHRVERGLALHHRNEVIGPLSRLRSASVGHRDERGVERLKVTQGGGERGLLGI